MRIILIRHAESLANENSKWYMYPDCVNILSARGVGQAVSLNKKMKHVLGKSHQSKQITVITSNLIRAKLTANIAMHGYDFPIKHDSRLDECLEDKTGVIIETSDVIKARIKSLIMEHDGELILFTHCHLMMWLLETSYIDNTEIKSYERDAFIDQFLKPKLIYQP